MSNLALRIVSALVLIPLVLALIAWATPLIFAGFLCLIAALAGFEFGDITLGRASPGHRFLVAASSALVCAAVALSGDYPWAPLAALALLFPITAVAFMLGPLALATASRSAAFSVAGAVYTGGLFGCMASIFSSGDPVGRYWLLLLACGTFVGDTLAYGVGRLLGKRKLAPRISPGKTWAGAVGGAIGTMGCVALAKATLLPRLEWLDVIAFGIPLAAACQLGDLIESFFKRGFGVKDSGRLIPGHGGILDRCDGLMLGAPVVYLMSLLR